MALQRVDNVLRHGVGAGREATAPCGSAKRSSSRSTPSVSRPAARRLRRASSGSVRAALRLLRRAAAVRSGPAGARGVPEVFAPVQHPRRQRQCRRDRAHRRTSSGCGSSRWRLRRRTSKDDATATAAAAADRRQSAARSRRHEPRTPHRTRSRRAARALVAAAHRAARRRHGRGSSRPQRLAIDAPPEAYSTPRRLTVRVSGIAERQRDLEELVTGPPVSAATGPTASRRPRRSGSRRSTASRSLAWSACRRRRASTSRSASGIAAAPRSTRCPTCSPASCAA